MGFPKLLAVFLLYFFVAVQGKNENNLCTDWGSYNDLKNSQNCYYDPDVYANTPETIDRHLGKGHYENYTVTTKDGYILQMFRIVRENPKGVIMLAHPILGDGVVFVAGGNTSLAFTLWHMGYEVWLPNNRGTYFSEGHTKLNIHDLDYWSFSFEEIGLIDYPLFAEKIYNVSNTNEIILIGFSQGCTSSIIYASEMPEHAKKYFKVFIQMGAPVHFKYPRTMFRYLTPLEPVLRGLFKILHIGGVFYKDSITKAIADRTIYPPMQRLGVTIFELMFGWLPDEVDPVGYNLVLSRCPRGSSLMVMWHYLQLVNNGCEKFRRFDYGAIENLKRYKSITPPEYNLKKMEIPNYFLTSTSDYVVTKKDNDLLWNQLSDKAKKYGRVFTSGLNHIDFMVGKDRVEFGYKYIYEFLKKL